MRAYINIDGIKESCNVDCITMTNNTTDEVLNLSFCIVDCGSNDKGISIRLKDEETATFGLPESIDAENFGNNKETYDYIKGCSIQSIVLVPFENKVNLRDFNLQLKGLMICIGDYKIEYTDEQLKNVVLEDTDNVRCN